MRVDDTIRAVDWLSARPDVTQALGRAVAMDTALGTSGRLRIVRRGFGDPVPID